MVARKPKATATPTKSTLRSKATAFSEAFRTASREMSERHVFWIRFFEIFGLAAERVTTFEELARRSSTGGRGMIDVLWPGQMAIEHKSLGENLDEAMAQLLDYLPSLPGPQHPWLLVVCDFQTFQWHNLRTREQGEFRLADLSQHLDLFSWIAGYDTPDRQFENAEAVNLAAAQLMAEIYDQLAAHRYGLHETRVWLTRVLFCLFADDTGVWGRAAFHAFIALHTRDDGTDLGSAIATLFQIMNTPPAERPSTLREELDEFIYINGGLFSEQLPIPHCDAGLRDALLKACAFNWAVVSPAIFGSMFQNVMSNAERRQLGAHYTSEQNILKVIRPLFLDSLEEELSQARTKPALRAFLDKLPRLTFFDPACGCGNFLVIAYRELRRLEIEALRRLGEKEKRQGQYTFDISLELRVSVDQFFGIELEEFPARIAATALYIMDHQANMQATREFGQYYVRFPLPGAASIHIGNSLALDWNTVLPAARCNYIFGNPPYAGHVTRTPDQRRELQGIWGDDYAKWLDYVTAWFKKARIYDTHRSIRVAFVATNSVSQGEQVARLWSDALRDGYGIDFAHRTFAWTNEAQGRAHVHVVIIGFSHRGGKRPVLCSYRSLLGEPECEQVSHINPYLIDGPDILVKGRRTPLSPSMPPVRYGSLPSDGGGLICTEAEFPHSDKVAQQYLRPYVGSQELVNGEKRWIIWMPNGCTASELRSSTFLKERLEAVSRFRAGSRNRDTRDLAEQPYKLFHNAQPTGRYIGIPAQVSETRRWYIVDYCTPDIIASNTLYTAVDGDGFLFAILSSTMFIAWMRTIGGCIKSDLRYSKSVVHNPFPLPSDIPSLRRQAVVKAGNELLAARRKHGSAPLRDLYDPHATPPEIINAHLKIDREVDALFDARRRRWRDGERVNLLLRRYEQIAAACPQDEVEDEAGDEES